MNMFEGHVEQENEVIPAGAVHDVFRLTECGRGEVGTKSNMFFGTLIVFALAPVHSLFVIGDFMADETATICCVFRCLP